MRFGYFPKYRVVKGFDFKKLSGKNKFSRRFDVGFGRIRVVTWVVADQNYGCRFFAMAMEKPHLDI
jgi:hypothetical protein